MMMVASSKIRPFRRLSNTHLSLTWKQTSLCRILLLLSVLLLPFVPSHAHHADADADADDDDDGHWVSYASVVPESLSCDDGLNKANPRMTKPDTSTHYFRLNDDDDDTDDEKEDDDGMGWFSESDTITDYYKLSDTKEIKCSIFDTDINGISDGLPNKNNKHKKNDLNLCKGSLGVTMVSPYLVGFNVFGNGILHMNLSLYNPFDDVLYVKKVTAWLSVVFGNKLYFSCLVCRMEEITASLNCDQWSDEGMSNGYFRHQCQSWVDIQPHSKNKKWEIPPHDFKTILTVNLLPRQHVVGNVSGVIYVHLWNASSQGKSDAVKVPLEEVLMMQHKVSRYLASTTGSISVVIQHLVSVARDDDHKRSGFLLSLRNDVSQLLQVVKVCKKANNDKKIFRIRYGEGLIIYPGTLMYTAFIMYNLSDVPCGNLDCVLQIVTNESTVNSQIEIPCRDLVSGCSKHDSDSTLQKRIPQERVTTKSDAREVTKADELILPNRKYQGTTTMSKANELIVPNRKYQGTTTMSKTLSVLEDHDMVFPVVEVGTHCSKWVHVTNPSEKPAAMQLLLSSVSKINLCKPTSDSSEHHVTNRFTQISSTETSDGFSVGKSPIIEAFVHPSESVTFGPIVFHPSDRCTWTSLALIRNNLSGVEWLHLQGMGGTRSLVILEDSKAVENLEFNVDWSLVPLNLSTSESMFQTEQASPTCKHVLSKELLVKNAGQLSLQVLKLQVSGASCGLDGFTIHTCKPFDLAPGESTKLHVSYKADFSTAAIQRDLELALASGIFVIPMKANIPIYMMNLCKKSFVWSLRGMFPLIIFVLFPIIIGCLTHIFLSASKQEDYTIESGNAIATISKVGKPSRVNWNPRNQRKLPAVGIVSENDSGTVTNHREKDQNQGKGSKTELTGKTVESSMEESPPIGNLTLKIERGKGRRRKRRASRTLSEKLEVCSSQSGNSTPSSPLSPNTFTRPASNTIDRSKPLSVKCIGNSKDLKPVDEGSPIAPLARAPGPRLGENKVVKRGVSEEENSHGGQVKEYFPYDIWGNHLPDHIMGRCSRSGENKFLPWPFSDASEGVSLSFFASDPQSLVKMPSMRSASPNPKLKLPSYDVNL